jgi:hypothetical protein
LARFLESGRHLTLFNANGQSNFLLSLAEIGTPVKRVIIAHGGAMQRHR